jgi:hypothetical protein
VWIGARSNINMFLKEIGLEGAGRIPLAQGIVQWRDLVSTIIKLRGSVKCGEFLSKLAGCSH